MISFITDDDSVSCYVELKWTKWASMDDTSTEEGVISAEMDRLQTLTCRFIRIEVGHWNGQTTALELHWNRRSIGR